MGRQDPNLTVYEPFEADIWDRVEALAPTCKPVTGRLFAKPPARFFDPKAALSSRDILSENDVEWVDERPKASGNPGHSERPTLRSQKAVKNYLPSVSEATPRALGERDRAATIARAWAQLRPAVVDAPDMRQSLQASVARAADTVVSQSFDLLRMRLLQTLKDNGWRRVAITSPTPGCGSTFVACNLAVSLSRIREQRTLLMDLNLRAPGIAHAFALRNATDMAGFLAGEATVRQSIQKFGENVALGAGRSCATATAEMLYDTRTISALDQLEQDLQPDVMLFDLPPMLAYDDVSAFLPQVDGVLLISNGTKTMGKEIAACERAIAGRTKLLGVVLNETRKSDSKAAGYGGA